MPTRPPAPRSARTTPATTAPAWSNDAISSSASTAAVNDSCAGVALMRTSRGSAFRCRTMRHSSATSRPDGIDRRFRSARCAANCARIASRSRLPHGLAEMSSVVSSSMTRPDSNGSVECRRTAMRESGQPNSRKSRSRRSFRAGRRMGISVVLCRDYSRAARGSAWLKRGRDCACLRLSRKGRERQPFRVADAPVHGAASRKRMMIVRLAPSPRLRERRIH
jgi:hypothetical protein